ncbi:glycosyltransferase [Candidatus Pelagibacter communis]|uniref:glycosyltransferase n=1 Tax=Candidatus Pelagibacter TaxID=198251 RepID=UPI003EE40904
MKKKIYYWSPCLNPVGTVKSTMNSALSLSKFDKNSDVKIINACGEWNDYKDEFKSGSVEVIDLNFNYYKFLPKTGLIKSRLSYLIIFIFSFLPLLRLLKKYKPDVLIIHLITSLPMCLFYFFDLKTKLILRISGYPKLNYLRNFFWKLVSKKIYKITCPTNELKLSLVKNKVFYKKKVFFLPDAIIDITKFQSQTHNQRIKLPSDGEKKIILAAGRLTKQKNFTYLIQEFMKFSNLNDNFILIILGDGEEKNKLQNFIKINKLESKVHLLGHVKNVYKYMKKSDVFVLSSLWEEVGFVIVEAAISNLFVISSDCPNGPSEFLDYGRNGILFKTNNKNSLFKSFIDFVNEKDKFKKKVKAKKSSLKYTKFRHYKTLTEIIE